jgi:uncharacterized protein YdgA (DUF945 family)
VFSHAIYQSATGTDLSPFSSGFLMKKIIAILVAAGVIGVPAATWHFGNQAEASAQGFANIFSRAAPYVTVAGTEYKKGFFSSTQTIRLRGGMPGADAKGDQEIVIENVIDHGPLPGFSGVGAARITHNVIWPAAVKAELAKVWGDKAPLSAVTSMSMGGGGTTTFTSPAANGKNEDLTFAFQGLNGTMNFSSGFDKFDYVIGSEGATFEDKKGEKLTVGKLSGNGAQTKMAGTENIYLGKQMVSFAGMDATKAGKPAFSLKQVDYNAETTSTEANFVNATGKLSGNAFRVEDNDFGDLEYTFTMQKLHAPSLDALNKSIQAEMNKVAASGTAAAGKSDEAGKAMLNALKLHLPEISKHSPMINIDKMRIGNAKDYGQLNATVRLMPMLAADFDNPMALLPKVDAAMNIELSESAVALLAGKASGAMGMDPSMAAQMTPQQKAQMEAQTKSMVDQQLAGAVQQGYIVRTGGKVSAQITLKQGAVMVNGKPIGGGILGK